MPDAPCGIRSPWRHPPLNIALEEGLRSELCSDGGRGFFLCGRNEPAVIVGRNQNALAEVSPLGPGARPSGLPPDQRRRGGLPRHGNLNWGWVVPGGLKDRSQAAGPGSGRAPGTGHRGRGRPRSGIFVGRQKIGGTACAVGKGVLLFHGTLLVSTNLEELQSALAAHAPAYPAPDRARTLRRASPRCLRT